MKPFVAKGSAISILRCPTAHRVMLLTTFIESRTKINAFYLFTVCYKVLISSIFLYTK
jgi:hypothetical protein